MTTELLSLSDVAARYTLSIDHELALRAARRRLIDEFESAFTHATIERFLAGSYEQFAASARFPNYVHILAERFARLRLIAFAQVEPHLDANNPIVLFVCQHNDLHSQIARGLLEQRAGGSVLAWSAGAKPVIDIKPGVEELLNKAGISLANEFPKPIAPEMLSAATMVVTFGCADAVAPVAGRRDFHEPAPRIGDEYFSTLESLKDWIDSKVVRLLDRL